MHAKLFLGWIISYTLAVGSLPLLASFIDSKGKYPPDYAYTIFAASYIIGLVTLSMVMGV